MTGTNPDGSNYSDPGVPWVSYFNGGDALHGFDRAPATAGPRATAASEMPRQRSGRLPLTPLGTLVTVGS